MIFEILELFKKKSPFSVAEAILQRRFRGTGGFVVTFFIAKKVTKKASDSNNSLFLFLFLLTSAFAVSPVSISHIPLCGFMATKRSAGRLKQI